MPPLLQPDGQTKEHQPPSLIPPTTTPPCYSLSSSSQRPPSPSPSQPISLPQPSRTTPPFYPSSCPFSFLKILPSLGIQQSRPRFCSVPRKVSTAIVGYSSITRQRLASTLTWGRWRWEWAVRELVEERDVWSLSESIIAFPYRARLI